MTDARIPERWLMDARLAELSDPGHRLFVNALVWAVSNRTDGIIPSQRLRLVPHANHSHAGELVESGLWVKEGDDYFIPEFLSTQTTASQLAGLDAKRAQTRDRVARHRSSKSGVTRYTKDRTETGEARTGGSTRDTTEDDEWEDEAS